MSDRDGLVARLREGTVGSDIPKTDVFLNTLCSTAADQIERDKRENERLREALEKIRHWDWQVAEPHGGDIPENVEPWARELDDACTQMQRIARAALNGEAG